MLDKLSQSHETAERIRFSGDVSIKNTHDNQSRSLTWLRNSYSQDYVHISDLLTPQISSNLQKALNNLNVPSDAVQAFIYSSPEIQAACYPYEDIECILCISSALVDLLSEEEIMFVVGHELGHFLLGHTISVYQQNHASPELLMLQRAQEISADRMGLMACQSLDIALRALMKTASGLTAKHLRFDVRAFIAQLKNVDQDNLLYNRSSHPSIVVRSKSLLWFSLSEIYNGNTSPSLSSNKLSLDEKITRDLDRYINGPVREEIDSAERDLELWLSIQEITLQKSFSKKYQAIFKNKFGEKMLNKTKSFLSDLSDSGATDEVANKVRVAKDKLEFLAPISFAEKYTSIVSRVDILFRVK